MAEVSAGVPSIAYGASDLLALVFSAPMPIAVMFPSYSEYWGQLATDTSQHRSVLF